MKTTICLIFAIIIGIFLVMVPVSFLASINDGIILPLASSKIILIGLIQLGGVFVFAFMVRAYTVQKVTTRMRELFNREIQWKIK